GLDDTIHRVNATPVDIIPGIGRVFPFDARWRRAVDQLFQQPFPREDPAEDSLLSAGTEGNPDRQPVSGLTAGLVASLFALGFLPALRQVSEKEKKVARDRPHR